MTRSTALVLTGLILFLPGGASAQAKQYPLESVDGQRLHHVSAEPATLQGKKGLRVTLAANAARPEGMPAAQLEAEQLAWIDGLTGTVAHFRNLTVKPDPDKR